MVTTKIKLRIFTIALLSISFVLMNSAIGKSPRVSSQKQVEKIHKFFTMIYGQQEPNISEFQDVFDQEEARKYYYEKKINKSEKTKINFADQEWAIKEKSRVFKCLKSNYPNLFENKLKYKIIYPSIVDENNFGRGFDVIVGKEKFHFYENFSTYSLQVKSVCATLKRDLGMRNKQQKVLHDPSNHCFCTTMHHNLCSFF